MKTGKLYNVIRSIQCIFIRHIFNDIGMSTVLEPSDLGIRTTITASRQIQRFVQGMS